MAKSTLLTASPGEDLLVHGDAHRVERAALNLTDLQFHVVLPNLEIGGLLYAHNCAEAKSAIFTVTPRIHLVMTRQRQDVADTAGDLHDSRAEFRESHHCRPRDDLHLGLRELIFFGALRTGSLLELTVILALVLVYSLARAGINYWQFLIEGR